jgi:hypothetical protein
MEAYNTHVLNDTLFFEFNNLGLISYTNEYSYVPNIVTIFL